jgi:hypothetical protein
MNITNEICTEIENRLKDIPAFWDGKACILEMKDADYPQWKQMEWMGFYFQYLCEKHLAGLFQFQMPKYGKTAFDGLYQVPFDFKAHAENTSSHNLIVNDSEAISKGIEQYGCVGVIIAIGEVVYNDKDRSFQKWHEALKGGKSAYELARIERGAWSRLRKYSFTLHQISIVQITDATFGKVWLISREF